MIKEEKKWQTGAPDHVYQHISPKRFSVQDLTDYKAIDKPEKLKVKTKSMLVFSYPSLPLIE